MTNIDTALEQAATDPGLADKTRRDFMLMTDGEQAGCSLGGGAAGAIQAVHDLYVEAGVPTFAIGFGSSANPVFLGAIAEEGGTAPAGRWARRIEYYLATDQAALLAAFQDIAQKAIGCVFKLDTAPPDPQKLYVFVNGSVQVSRDATHATGWDYDNTTNTVTFYGSTCDDLKQGKVSMVRTSSTAARSRGRSSAARCRLGAQSCCSARPRYCRRDRSPQTRRAGSSP